MSEKRFVCIDVDYGDDWYITDNGKRLSEMEIVDLLNEQQDTIHSLQKDIIEMSDNHQSYIEMESETHSKMNDIVRTQRGKIFRLDRENKELRQILKDIVGATDETYTKNTSMFKVTVVLDNEKYREIRGYIE